MKVSVDVPDPPVTELELNEHVGAGVAAGVTAHVRFTVPVKPFTGAMVIVEVAVPPFVTVAGERPPPPEDEPPPQAARKTRPEIIRQASSKPRSFLRLHLEPVPSNASPPIGSHIA